MESLILPAQCRPPAANPFKQDVQMQTDVSSKPPLKASASFSITQQPLPGEIIDARLHYLCKSGLTDEAIAALDALAHCGLKVKSKTYTQLLDYCIELNKFQLGRVLHARVHLVDKINPFVGTTLIGMYAKCGSLAEARKVFDEMVERNLFSWSAIIGAYHREHRWAEVLDLFGMMMGEGTLPDHFLLPKILVACGNCGDYGTGKVIHSLVVRCGLSCYTHVSNALMSAYAKCGRLSLAWRFFVRMDERDLVSWNSIIYAHCQRGKNAEARWLFDMMREEGIEPSLLTWNVLISGHCQSGDCSTAMNLKKEMEDLGLTPDVFTWTSLISGCAQNSRAFEALELFMEMLFWGVQPTRVTIASVVSACASLKSLKNGQELHSLASKMELAENVLVGNSLIDMYSKCGELEAAYRVFDAIFEKDAWTWNSMISGYCQGGYLGKAYDLFMKMQESGLQPSAVTWNLIISAYVQSGSEDRAMDLFHQMGKGGIVKPDTSSWNSLISGYLQIGDKNKAFGLFRKMQSYGVRPNSVTVLTILAACGNLIAANKVREIHTCTLRRGLVSEVAVANFLIDSYAKSGNIVYSRAVFDMMPSKDIITWNSLIAGYVLHGCSSDALNAFDQMRSEGHRPNQTTLLSVILACGLVKMVDKGKRIYSSMIDDYQILPTPEHCFAMVDLLGRSGRLGEAIDFVEHMTSEPDSSIWHALLTAGRTHGDALMMILPAERLLELDPGDNVTRHLVAQAYRISGSGTNSLKERMPHKSRSKLRGCSLVEVENTVYSFLTGDQSSPAFHSTYAWLRSMARNIHLPDPHWIFGIEEEDREQICGIHSEKLALGFALNGTARNGRFIRIMKNFRICRDCHSTFKFVSSSCSCEIYLSDTKCLHHFKNGNCSCGDYCSRKSSPCKYLMCWNCYLRCQEPKSGYFSDNHVTILQDDQKHRGQIQVSLEILSSLIAVFTRRVDKGLALLVVLNLFKLVHLVSTCIGLQCCKDDCGYRRRCFLGFAGSGSVVFIINNRAGTVSIQIKFDKLGLHLVASQVVLVAVYYMLILYFIMLVNLCRLAHS
ncbi:hypothetical protein Dimus_026061 [Dionaea muscipula]